MWNNYTICCTTISYTDRNNNIFSVAVDTINMKIYILNN